MKRELALATGSGSERDRHPVEKPLSRSPEVDDLDRAIIAILQRDGRRNNSEIARALGVTETTIRKRLSSLINNDLLRIVAVATPRIADLNISAILGISVELRRLSEVARGLAKRPEIRYIGVAAGRYDIILEVFFSSNEHVVEFTTNVLGQMDGVLDVETSVILRVEKFSYEWEIP
jgi:Lrp/AsnC family transcriptional regulator, regulator for asnA, asnC and gidA